MDSIQEVCLFLDKWITEDPQVNTIVKTIKTWSKCSPGYCSIKQPDAHIVDYVSTAMRVDFWGLSDKTKYRAVENKWYKYFLIAFFWQILGMEDIRGESISAKLAGDIMEALLATSVYTKRFSFALSVLRVYSV